MESEAIERNPSVDAVVGDRVKLAVRGGIAVVRLIRAEKHNGFDEPMFDALNEALDRLGGDEQLRAVVISGDGPSFSAGLDFKAYMADPNGSSARLFAHRDGDDHNRAQRSSHGWRTLPVPVIAALHGACFGAGLQLALAADLRIAAPDSQLSVMEIRYGLIPDMGLSQTLPRLVRDDVARELTYTGRVVGAEEALELGLVTRIEQDPRAAALQLAGEIAGRSAGAIRSAKRLLSDAPRGARSAGLALEEELQRQLLGSPSQLAAVAEALRGS
jgi:enoyl-CoA hydratase/carnithine racemase